MNQKIEEHLDMVMRLNKPAADIIASLTEEKVNILHMAVGISGEAGELMGASLEPDGLDIENLKEECGDFEYYLRGLCKYTDLHNNFAQVGKMPLPPIGYRAAIRHISADAGEALDLVKKCVVYNREEGLDTGKLGETISRLYGRLNAIYHLLGVTRDEILEANMQKLEKGKNARYADGYSDEAAELRVDKMGGPESDAEDEIIRAVAESDTVEAEKTTVSETDNGSTIEAPTAVDPEDPYQAIAEGSAQEEDNVQHRS